MLTPLSPACIILIVLTNCPSRRNTSTLKQMTMPSPLPPGEPALIHRLAILAFSTEGYSALPFSAEGRLLSVSFGTRKSHSLVSAASASSVRKAFYEQEMDDLPSSIVFRRAFDADAAGPAGSPCWGCRGRLSVDRSRYTSLHQGSSS